MADNVAITAGSGTNVATDDLSGVHYQRVKVSWGADGVANDANATTPLPTTEVPTATTPTTTSVSSSATSVTILASNASRKTFAVYNDSTAILSLSFSTPATVANSFVRMAAGAYYEHPLGSRVTGVIYGIWASANGTAQITEYV